MADESERAPLVPLLTAYDVARLLGVHYRTVHRLRKDGLLSARAVYGSWRFTEDDVREFIDAQKTGAVHNDRRRDSEHP